MEITGKVRDALRVYLTIQDIVLVSVLLLTLYNRCRQHYTEPSQILGNNLKGNSD